MHRIAACIATPSLGGKVCGESKNGNHVKLVGKKMKIKTAKLR
jgi:hypothetical protein